MADHNFFRILGKFPGLGTELCYPLRGLTTDPISGSYDFTRANGSHSFLLDKNYSGFDASYITSSDAANNLDITIGHKQVINYNTTLYYSFNISAMTDNFRIEQFGLDHSGDGRNSEVTHISSFYTSSEAIFNALGLTKSNTNNTIKCNHIRLDSNTRNDDPYYPNKFIYTTITELDSQDSYRQKRSFVVQLKMTGSSSSNEGYVETIDINHTDTKAIEINNNGDYCYITGLDIGHQYTSSLAGSGDEADFRKSIYVFYHTSSYADGSGSPSLNTIMIEKLPVTGSVSSGNFSLGLLVDTPSMRQYSSSKQVNDWPSSYLISGGQNSTSFFTSVPSWWVDSFDAANNGNDEINYYKIANSPVNTNYLITYATGYATLQLLTWKDPSDGRTANIGNAMELYTCEKVGSTQPFYYGGGISTNISNTPFLDGNSQYAHYTFPIIKKRIEYQTDCDYTASFFAFNPSASYRAYSIT
jgi:hypothetical protein